MIESNLNTNNTPYNPVKTSFFDEFADDRKEYEFDFEKVWIPYAKFQKIEKEFPYFSKNPLIEGLLFKKSKKTTWFRNRFFVLYQDRLVYYQNVSQYPNKVMLLRGVTMHLAEDVVSTNEMDIKLTIDEIEKRSFIFTRNKKYSIISAGTRDMHEVWLEQLKKCMILTNFNKYYSILRPIAKGTFAKVIECKRLSDSKTFAVKTLEKNNILNSLSAVRSKIGLINEINILRRLDHPNIIHLYEVYEGKYNIYLVMEHLKGGEIFNEIANNGCFSEKHASIIMLQLLRALDYLHNKGFVHRDLKLENLIFVSSGTLDMKIADFGLSENLSKQKWLFKRCGTPGYVAPEILADEIYSYKCDIFSSGIILWIILTGFSPFYAANYQEILVKNKQCNLNFNLAETHGLKISEQAINLLKWMLELDPQKRPTAKEALNHAWFLEQMTEDEKKNHLVLQRKQANLLKAHELKIQPKSMKRSKSIELTMKTPDVMIPFDPYSNLRSPIMTPEILQLKPKKISDSKNKLNEENKIELKNDFNEKKEKDRLQGSTPVIENEKETKKAYKKNYGSTNLVSRKISSDFKNEKK